MNSRYRLITIAISIMIVACFIVAIVYAYYNKHNSEDLVVINNKRPNMLSVDLQSVFYGQAIERSINIKNGYDNPLILEGVTQCGCTKITLDKNYVEAKDIAVVTFKYDSSRKQDIGQTSNSFVIYNIINAAPGKKERVPVAQGEIKTYVKPTIKISPDRFKAFIAKNKSNQFTGSFELTNESNHNITLSKFTESSSRGQIIFRPDKFHLKPSEKTQVEVNISLLDFSIPYANDVKWPATLHVGNSKADLLFSYPVNIIPFELITTIPGSLFFSDSDRNKSKILTLSTLENRNFFVQSIDAPKTLYVKKIAENQYNISLNLDNLSTGTFNLNVVFHITVDDDSFDVEVPVMGLLN